MGRTMGRAWLAIATKIGMEMKLQVENWMVRPPVRWLLDRAG